MYEINTKPTNVSVRDFIESIPDEQKRKDSIQLVEMMSELTREDPVLWGSSIIGFGRMTYQYESGHSGETFLVGFSPRKQNLTIYAASGWKGREDVLARLGKCKTSKVCLYINRLSQVDIGVLREILIQSLIDPTVC